MPDGRHRGTRAGRVTRLSPAQMRNLIRAETRPIGLSFVSPLRIHGADEAVPLWQRTEERLGGEDIPPPFWAFAWAGGQGLARWVLDHPAEVAGQDVLDFASGCGVVGLAAARVGAERVTCVDIDPLAGAAAEANAALNRLKLRVRTDEVVGRSRAEIGAPDLVLVGDVHYEREAAARMTPWFERLAGEGARVLVGDPERTYFPHDRGWREIARYDVPVPRDLEDRDTRSVGVFEVTSP